MRPAIYEYPDTMGVPPELYAKRIEGEDFKEYKARLRKNERMIRNFLDELVGDVKMPSCRILRRIKQGKRTIRSLNNAERYHIKAVIGFNRHKETEEEWEARLWKFLAPIPAKDIGGHEFWAEMYTAMEEHRDGKLDETDE